MWRVGATGVVSRTGFLLFAAFDNSGHFAEWVKSSKPLFSLFTLDLKGLYHFVHGPFESLQCPSGRVVVVVLVSAWIHFSIQVDFNNFKYYIFGISLL